MEDSIVARVKRLVESGKPPAVVILEFRISGFGMFAAVDAVKQILACSTAQAKDFVHESVPWSDGRNRREDLWEELENAIEDLESGKSNEF